MSTTSSQTIQVLLPELGESVTEGIVVEWRVAEGDAVEAGDTLLDVTTDKVDVEVPAPAAGRVTRIVAAAGRDRRGGRPPGRDEPGRRGAANGGASPTAAAPAPRGAGRGRRRRAPAAEPAGAGRRPRPRRRPSRATTGADRAPRHGVGDRGRRGRVARRRGRRGRRRTRSSSRSRPTRSTSRCRPRPPAASPRSPWRPAGPSPSGSRSARSRPGAGAASGAAPARARRPRSRRAGGGRARPRPAAAPARRRRDVEWPAITPVARRLALEKGIDPADRHRHRARRDHPQGRRAGRGRARPPPAAAPRAAASAPGRPPARRPSPLRGPAAALAGYMDESLSIPTATSFRTLTVAVARRPAAPDQRRPEGGRPLREALVHAPDRLGDRAGGRRAARHGHRLRRWSTASRTSWCAAAVNLGLAVDVERKDGSRSLLVPVVRDAGPRRLRRLPRTPTTTWSSAPAPAR